MRALFQIGDTVQYISYGELKTGKILRVSSNGSLLFLEGNKWIHSISATLIN
jgi:hypothetical protein